MNFRKYFISAAIALTGIVTSQHAQATRWDPTQSQGWQQDELRASVQKSKPHRFRRERGWQSSSSTTEPIPQNTGVGPRPSQWCGWWMRTQKGGGPEYNIAWNWRNYGVPTAPQVGAIVVWRHHVGILMGQTAKGHWIVKSGNDSGSVRTRARSIEGAIFRI